MNRLHYIAVSPFISFLHTHTSLLHYTSRCNSRNRMVSTYKTNDPAESPSRGITPFLPWLAKPHLPKAHRLS